MGYLHIDNLYKNQSVLQFKECYALEKIHGTSAHLRFYRSPDWKIHFFSGGEKHENFVKLFDEKALLAAFRTTAWSLANLPVTVYGEAYGGKQQAMSATYGKDLKYVVFDVKVGEETWLTVPYADALCKLLGLEFVAYSRVSTELAALDKERDLPSVQAMRNGVGPDKKREGIIIRPLLEASDHRGNRLIAKHKTAGFAETRTERPVVDPSKMLVLMEAQAIADEWVTAMRLAHVLDKLPDHSIEKMRDIIRAMQEDVLREGAGELVDSPAVRSAIGKKTAVLYKERLQAQLHDIAA